MKIIIGSMLILVGCLFGNLAMAAVHSQGQNVLGTDGTIYFITSDSQKRPYTSAGAFLSYGLNSFSGTLSASVEDMALPTGPFIPPQDGKIICSDRGSDKGTCYLISQGARIGFPSAEIFLGQGFSFKNASVGDVSFLTYPSNIQSTSDAHSPGVLINNNGTIYFVGKDGLIGVPSVDTFKSWGYSFADVVSANSADKQKTINGVMATKIADQLSPIIINTTPNTQTPPASNTTPAIVYETQDQTYRPKGLVTISADTNAPATQQVVMNTKDVLLYTIKFQETSGNEQINLKGLKIRAKIYGGTTLGNGLPNTAYYTFKNFTLTSGSTVIARPTWSSETPPREGGVSGGGEQTYVLDFLTNSPLDFKIASSSTITLTLKAEANPWLTEASANSAWTFNISNADDVVLTGQNSRANIAPSFVNLATSNTTTVIKQPVTFSAVSSFTNNGLYATAQGIGNPTTLETMAIFKPVSLSGSGVRLSTITLAQSGSTLPTGTSSPVTYYVYDGSQSLSQPVGIGVLSGTTAVKIKLNLNSAATLGVTAPPDGSGYLIISADTTNFAKCTLNCTGETFSYGLKLTAWEWTDPSLYNLPYTGPFTTDTAKDAIFSDNKTSRTY